MTLRTLNYGNYGLFLRLMDKILHYLKDPKLWELWCIFLIMGNAGFCPSAVVACRVSFKGFLLKGSIRSTLRDL